MCSSLEVQSWPRCLRIKSLGPYSEPPDRCWPCATDICNHILETGLAPPDHEYTLVFPECGKAHTELEIAKELGDRGVSVSSVMLMDRVLEASGTIHTDTGIPIRMLASYAELVDELSSLQSQQHSCPKRRLLVPGVHQSHTFMDPGDLRACVTFLSHCDRWASQGALHPHYLNFRLCQNVHLFSTLGKDDVPVCNSQALPQFVHSVPWSHKADQLRQGVHFFSGATPGNSDI